MFISASSTAAIVEAIVCPNIGPEHSDNMFSNSMATVDTEDKTHRRQTSNINCNKS